MNQTDKQESNLVHVVLAFLMIYVIWGSTYLWNKIVIEEIPPITMAGFRFTIASLLIFLWCKLRGTSLKITRQQSTNTFISGLLFLTLGNGGMVWALQYIDSGFASLLTAAQPLVLLILLYFLENREIQVKSLTGVVLGMAGIFLLVSQDVLVSTDSQWFGVLLIVGCLLCWGYGSIFVAKKDLPSNYLVNTGYQMFFGGVLMIIIGLLINEEYPDVSQLSSRVIICFVLLVLFGSIAAFTSFNYLLRNVSPEKVASSTYVNPIVAMVLGWYVLGEVITPRSILAAGILLTGVFFINSAKGEALTQED